MKTEYIQPGIEKGYGYTRNEETGIIQLTSKTFQQIFQLCQAMEAGTYHIPLAEKTVGSGRINAVTDRLNDMGLGKSFSVIEASHRHVIIACVIDSK